MALNRSLLTKLGPILVVLLFVGALIFVHHELHGIHYHDLSLVIRAYPFSILLLSLLSVFASYAALMGYDALGLKYAGCKLAFPKIALTSFLSFVFSNNFGFSALTGSLMRLRFYSIFGIGAMDTMKIAGFSVLTFWTGILLLGGVALVWDPIALPPLVSWSSIDARSGGILLLAVFALYLLIAVVWRKPLHIRTWSFQAPRPTLILGQVVVSSIDWVAATAALYILLPAHAQTGFISFIAIFILAQSIGLVSHVPGGLGVFEATMLFFLPHTVPRSEIFAALLAYRALYYFMPLVLASLLFAGFELYQRMVGIKKAYSWVQQFIEPIAPILSAAVVFFSGVLLLFSGSTRALPYRVEWLNHFLPLTVLEASHFFASLAGIALLILARGLQYRLIAAYNIAIWLLGAGAIFSLLKGFDFEEALLLLGTLLLLLPARAHFQRHSSIRTLSFTPAWIVSIVLILIAVVWLGLFSYQHVEYSHELWWSFTLHGNASRFLRATVGISALLLFFMGWRMFGPTKASVAERPITVEEMRKLAPIVNNYPKTFAHLALLGDKSILFNEKQNAYIMFRGEGRSLVAMGDPVGPSEEIPELIWRFKTHCDQYGAKPVFYQVGSDHLGKYIDIGLSFVKLGEEALIALDSFSMEGKAFQGMRSNLHHAEKEGVTFSVIPISDVAQYTAELKAISDSWILSKNAKEKGFSLGYFDNAYMQTCPVAVARKEGRIVAFANLWVGNCKDEMSLDLMRYATEAPKGIMDYLFANVLLYGKAEGYHSFNLGMAPLSGIEDRPLAPLWSKAGSFLYRHGEHFYNFQGLRQYKEKFHPVWESRYLAYPGGLSLPWVLTNLTTLISGGVKGTLSK